MAQRLHSPTFTRSFYTGTPVLPFGFGLSYTTWAYTPFNPSSGSTLDLKAIHAAAEAQAATGVVGHIPATLQDIAVFYYVNVTNTGAVDSDEVVLGFLAPPGNGTNGVPIKVGAACQWARPGLGRETNSLHAAAAPS